MSIDPSYVQKATQEAKFWAKQFQSLGTQQKSQQAREFNGGGMEGSAEKLPLPS